MVFFTFFMVLQVKVYFLIEYADILFLSKMSAINLVKEDKACPRLYFVSWFWYSRLLL